jgi:hypothetical protein
VHAGVLSRLEIARESSGGSAPLKRSKGDEEEKPSRSRLSFGGRVFAHFTEILEEEIEQSKFSGENLRSCEDHRIQRSCRVVRGR